MITRKVFPQGCHKSIPTVAIFWPNVSLNYVAKEHLHTAQIFLLLRISSSTSTSGIKNKKTLQSPLGLGCGFINLYPQLSFPYLKLSNYKVKINSSLPTQEKQPSKQSLRSLTKALGPTPVLHRWKRMDSRPLTTPQAMHVKKRCWALKLGGPTAAVSFQKLRKPGVGGLPKSVSGLFYEDHPRLF